MKSISNPEIYSIPMTEEIEKLIGKRCSFHYDNIDMKEILGGDFKHVIESYKGVFIGVYCVNFMILKEDGSVGMSTPHHITFDLDS